ncbi:MULTISPECIES: branched-chain amino acid ABC transporter substrate-binding protein [Streptomyces]|uniref:Branched-chain amino acid ABC transporter substrate-binding protein n=1 Tax=Streptomyces mirabilis TaxID=68239 RepID=A0ABU3UWA5_9ACTN|nr:MULTISPECIES: branched-chain amino acid ABC transporter substrate-binding protein [Streptomyces]MCX4608011.1 branched-chain amino acid ABC transporter substrate-binding protein [Streptomyces mirabilis]MCX5348476.1 branched-chain amino acid ABC transporter substrate-binding protein [Streptomyces mirabilis]MDU8998123.1 branched-chain amino acid ABC transporter substrate-binding protein [Streptomyces mirabilis]SOE26958.1 amino acid/amide ABC transporter substrate-binding protein, HAAT family [S
MRQRSLVILTSVLTTGALTLTACGSRDNSGDKSSSSKTEIIIGVDAPLTGQNSATGLGIQGGVQIAVDDANKNNTVPGVTFKVQALDDKAIPASGQQNATALVNNEKVLGVVGPLNSGVATQMQQVFATANLVEISPSNTAPELTQGKNWQTSKSRPFKTYFRTATTDALQGGFAAEYASSTLKKKNVFVVDDKQTYGAGLAKLFKAGFTKNGGKVAGEDHVNTGDTDFSALVTKIKNSKADLVYYGGQYDESEKLTKQLKDGGVKVPLFGGDGMFSDTYIQTAGKTSEGDLATSVGQPVDSLPSAADFIKKYKASGLKGDYGTYGGYSYDAATAIIKAIANVVKDGKVPDGARAKIVDEVQKTKFEGIAGPVSFDEYGDTTNKQLTVYQVVNGKWKAVKSGTFNG